jgi:hypothetical protein
MTTKEERTRTGTLHHAFVWAVGYAAIAVSVVLARYASIFDDADFEPLRDKAQDALTLPRSASLGCGLTQPS